MAVRLRVVTWNVNSIRTRLPRLLALLGRHDPDVVCLQETKVEDKDFPVAPLRAAGYHAALFGQRGYNGVAILSKAEPWDVQRGFPDDPAQQSRVIGATYDGLRVINVYAINGQSPGSEKYDLKLYWYRAFRDWLKDTYAAQDPVLIVGDFNVAPEDRDVHDPKRWMGEIHCSPPERVALADILALGYRDLLRERHLEPGFHTWWDYRLGAFHRGWGLRIDLALGTPPVVQRCRDVTVDREERKETTGEGKPSDHAPVLVELDDAPL